MSENTNTTDTIASYLGTDFQLKLLWQITTESLFCEKILPFLEVGYFDDHNYKRYFIVMKEYLDKYTKVPNLGNKSILHAIKEFRQDNPIDEEQLNGVLNHITIWHEGVLNGNIPFDGDTIQKQTWHFIKQQQYKKLANEIIEKLVRGRLDKNVYVIEERIKKISEVGTEDDTAVDIFDNIEMALRKEFREPIATGVKVIDEVTGGGLGRGEIGVVLAPTGAGKSTILTQFANNAYNLGKNVLQIIFEDTPDQIRRKHFAIWSKVPLSMMDDDNEKVIQLIRDRETDFRKEGNNNKLIIRRFSQESTTLPMIKDYILRYQKKHGIKFDLVILDYIDCVNSHKTGGDINADELTIIKSFESMAAELNVPCWTAIQTNRSGIEAELIYAHNMGGNIKRAQKTHFLMSIARTQDQKLHNLATLQILKARFAKDGWVFPDCIFNNDTLEIRATTDLKKLKSNEKDYEKNEPEKLNEKMRRLDTNKKEEEPNHNKLADLQKMINNDNIVDLNEYDNQDTDSFNKELEKFREKQKEKFDNENKSPDNQ